MDTLSFDPLKVLTDPLELIRFILSQKQWTGTHNGVALTSVDRLDAGENLKAQRTWVSAICHEGATRVKLMGSMKNLETGKRGGQDVIQVSLNNGPMADVGNDDIVAGGHIAGFPHLDLVLSYKYNDAVHAHRWDFKTRLF